MKKRLLVFVIVLINSSVLFAQDRENDFSKAKEIATKENKPIILVFQGSDWCAPCIKLDREILSSDTFKKYANENYVMLKADFPKRKKNAVSKAQTKANALLAEKYNKYGYFPFVVVLDFNGKILGETSYKKTSPENYIKKIKSFIK